MPEQDTNGQCPVVTSNKKHNGPRLICSYTVANRYILGIVILLVMGMWTYVWQAMRNLELRQIDADKDRREINEVVIRVDTKLVGFEKVLESIDRKLTDVASVRSSPRVVPPKP